jgi:hypothetical protein
VFAKRVTQRFLVKGLAFGAQAGFFLLKKKLLGMVYGIHPSAAQLNRWR